MIEFQNGSSAKLGNNNAMKNQMGLKTSVRHPASLAPSLVNLARARLTWDAFGAGATQAHACAPAAAP